MGADKESAPSPCVSRWGFRRPAEELRGLGDDRHREGIIRLRHRARVQPKGLGIPICFPTQVTGTPSHVLFNNKGTTVKSMTSHLLPLKPRQTPHARRRARKRMRKSRRHCVAQLRHTHPQIP